jgi:hypothetical protein
LKAIDPVIAKEKHICLFGDQLLSIQQASTQFSGSSGHGCDGGCSWSLVVDFLWQAYKIGVKSYYFHGMYNGLDCQLFR